MSTLEDSLQKAIGTKPYCSKKQLVDFYISQGLCSSYTGATAALQGLPWVQISPKRRVVQRNIALEHLSKHFP